MSATSNDVPRIEPMTEGDVGAVAELDPTMGVTEEQLRAELHRPWSRLWVGRAGHDVVAFAIAWHVADELLVLNLATRPDHRRRGMGRRMMTTLIDYARASAARTVLLELRRTNAAALALYRGVGFYATGVRARYYSDGEDAIEMRLDLDPSTGDVVRRADEVSVDV